MMVSPDVGVYNDSMASGEQSLHKQYTGSKKNSLQPSNNFKASPAKIKCPPIVGNQLGVSKRNFSQAPKSYRQKYNAGVKELVNQHAM